MTRIRRAARISFVALFALAAGLRADWKAELLARLTPRPDYRAAWEYLQEEANKLEPEDKQTAAVLLPYLAGKVGESALEQDLASAYFETYRDNDPDFGFLDDATRRDFLSFWVRWKRTYPLVYDISLLSYPRTGASGLPYSIEVGLDLLNAAFYRLSLGPYILEGGYWPRGFHILTIPVGSLFERSETYEFILDLKAGDLIVRKPIRLQVDVADVVAPFASPARKEALPSTPSSAQAIREGEISLYIDNKLILRSRKITAPPAPLTFPLPGPSMAGQKPYLPPPKDNPMSHGVSILDALALAYKALKDLIVKKPLPPSPPSYQKAGSLSFAYSRTTAEGLAASSRASVTLVPVRAAVYRE